ncbi:MAG TPA: c-type cytochrome [Bryobacteraceae bacterium]|nr:c-type cytochrome [Bryobacteraceae bacterium]
MWSTLACALLLVAPSLCFAQADGNPFTGNPQEVAAGARAFAVSCAPCHGRTGEGTQGQAEGIKPPDLTRGVYKFGSRDGDLYHLISRGIPESGMPSFEQLGTAQIWRLIAYVRTLPQPRKPATGDAVAGEALFQGKGRCGQCHAVRSTGGGVGPNLSYDARLNDPQKIRRAIVAPDDEIAPGYTVVTIVTRDHQTLSGIARFFDDFSARVADSSGGERTYLRDEVISMQRDTHSLMPDNYGTVFSSAELDDLVAYVIKLRTEGRGQ